MKLILTGLVALAMAGAPLMARQEPQEDKDKPKKEEPKKPEPKAKPETKPKQEPQPKPDEKQQPKPDPKTDKERAKQDEKQQREETRPAPQKQSAQQGRGGGRGQRIPEERFRASFGREHHFHVRRDQRFQYGGYWFEVAQPWPAAWVFDDDCFVEEDGDTYYLVDAMHPDVRVVVIVVEG